MMPDPWKQAQSVADLGELTAQWLEGRIPEHPGTVGPGGPDPETKRLIRVLAAINRAGFVTTDSQPGHPAERGYDRRVWMQRAAVCGWIADKRLFTRVRAQARRAGILIITHRTGGRLSPAEPVTIVDGQPFTWFGESMGHRRQISYEWRGIGAKAAQELRRANQITLIDPEWGRDNQLWPALERACR